MIANRILHILLSITSLLTLPLVVISTQVLGLGVIITFGLLLLPLSLIWIICFWAPLLGMSWLCSKLPILRNVLGIILIPWAVVAEIYTALIPAMGELESRALKLMFCESWPYCWEFHQFSTHKLDWSDIGSDSKPFRDIVTRMTSHDPLMQRVFFRIISRESMDPNT